MATTIEPCPFCRSTHLHIAQNGLSFCVVCQSCKSRGPHCPDMEGGIEQWNCASRKVVGTVRDPTQSEYHLAPLPLAAGRR